MFGTKEHTRPGFTVLLKANGLLPFIQYGKRLIYCIVSIFYYLDLNNVFLSGSARHD